MSVHYLRLSVLQKSVLWQGYGRFLLLGVATCAVSLAVAHTHMKMVENGFLAHRHDDMSLVLLQFPQLLHEKWAAYSDAALYQGAWTVLYPMELALTSTSKLIALDYIVSIFRQAWDPVYGPHIIRIRWLVYGAVQSANLVGIAFMIASSLYWFKVKVEFEKAAELYFETNSLRQADNVLWNVSRPFSAAQYSQAQGLKEYQEAARLGFQQNICEVISLSVITSAFVLLGRWCARRIEYAVRAAQQREAGTDVVEVGTSLKRKVVVSAVAIFFVFIFRFGYAIVSMISNNSKQQPAASGCIRICSSCQTNEWIVRMILFYHPWIYVVLTAFASPIILVVMLWGMVRFSIFCNVF